MKNHSFLKGSITKGLLFFALPLFFSNLFQQLYNTIDTVLIGHYLGDQSLAAMGATTAIFDLIVGFATGVGTGFGIITSRYFGAKNEDSLKESVALSIVIATILSLVLTLLSQFLLPGLLSLLHTPADIFDEALSYIHLITMFLIVTMFYNLSAGMLRAIGDSITPLFVLLIAAILNVILDVICITQFQMGVEGAAIATIIAQFIATIVCVIAIIKKARLLIPQRSHFTFDSAMISDLCAQGFSMGFMLSIVSIGTVVLQSAINQLGTSIIAAHTAARKLTALLSLPLGTLAASIATFVSQNKGAKQYPRIREGVKIANIMTTIYSIAVAILVLLASRQIVQLLSGSTNEIVISNGSFYLLTNIPFFVVLGPLLTLRNALQGLGHKIVPLVSSIIELVGKVIFTSLLIPYLNYAGVCFCEPIIWIVMTIQLWYTFYHSKEVVK